MIDRFRPRVSFANVTALVALFVALGGTAFAVQANSVKSRHIADGAVKSKDLRDNGVKSKDLRDDNVKSQDVKDGAIGGADLADGGVAAADIADGAVGRAAIADGGVGAVDLARGAVGRGQLAPDAVGFDEIEPDAVSTEHIEARAVAADELAERSVGREHVVIRCGFGRTNIAGLCWDTVPHEPTGSVFTAAEDCRAEGGRLPTPLQFRGARGGLELANAEQYWTDGLFFDGGLRAIVVSGAGGIAIHADGAEHQYTCVYEPFGI